MRNRLAERTTFKRYLTAEEERTLFQHVAKFGSALARRDLAWMRLLRQTGIRIGSLVAITVRQAREALASETLSLADEQVKGGHGYDVPLNKAARAALTDLLEARKAMGFDPLPDMPLVMSQFKKGISIRACEQRMAMWCAGAGLRVDASPHWLRHTIAMRVMQNSEARDPRGVVAVVLGHTNLRSSQVYTLPSREEVARTMEVVS